MSETPVKGSTRQEKVKWYHYLLTGIVIGFILAVVLIKGDFTLNMKTDEIIPVETMELNRKTSAEFQEAVLGASSQEKKLIVYSRDVSDTILLKKTGFRDWKILRKTKNIIFKGSATYTVDLNALTKDSIVVDENENTVTVYIPHPQLLNGNIIVNSEDIKFEDTEKGLLAFGDIKLTAEQNADIETNAKEMMKAKLIEEKDAENADRFAKLSTWEIFQPVVTAVSPDYTVVIEFQK